MMLIELSSTVLCIFSKFYLELRTICFPKNVHVKLPFISVEYRCSNMGIYSVLLEQEINSQHPVFYVLVT